MNNPIPLILLLLFLSGLTGAIIEDRIWFREHKIEQARADSICLERGHIADHNGVLTKRFSGKKVFIDDFPDYSLKVVYPIKNTFKCGRCEMLITNYHEPVIDTIWKRKL